MTTPAEVPVRSLTAVVSLIVLCVVTVAPAAEAALNSSWDAQLGIPPDSACWTRFDTAPLTDPVLASGKMTLATNLWSEAMYFEQSGPLLDVPATWVIEAGVRIVSESHDPGPRWGAAIGFVAAPGFGNVLLLGAGQIMLWGAFGVGGPTASIPTTDRVHDYRAELQSSGTISVFQDGVPVLSGGLIPDTFFGSTRYLYFGDGSSSGASTTEWTYFKHNGAASPCPGLAGVEDASQESMVAFERPYPNPASREILFRFALRRGERVRMSILDIEGRRVRTLEPAGHAQGVREARWDLNDDTGRPASAGLYFVRLDADGRRLVRRVVVTR